MWATDTSLFESGRALILNALKIVGRYEGENSRLCLWNDIQIRQNFRGCHDSLYQNYAGKKKKSTALATAAVAAAFEALTTGDWMSPAAIRKQERLWWSRGHSCCAHAASCQGPGWWPLRITPSKCLTYSNRASQSKMLKWAGKWPPIFFFFPTSQVPVSELPKTASSLCGK